MHGLAQHEAIVPGFVVLWVVASLLDLLPTVEERVGWQAKATIGLAAVRAVALSLAAVLTRDLGFVLLVLLAFAAFKVALLLAYVARHHGLRTPLLRPSAFVDQLRHGAPFGAAGALYCLRAQVDQWVVAALFSLGKFASFSIAAVLGPLVNLFRQSVNYVFLPSMSRLQAAGDTPGMLHLNSRANVMVGSLVYPLLAYVFAFAEELVTLVYTATYLDAAPVMRVCIVGLVALVVELASITLLLRQGTFVMAVNLAGLALSLSLNWFLAQRFGLAGAAVGSVIAIYLDRSVTLWRIALLTGVRVRRLQDWRTLGLLLLLAALAAAFAWYMVARYFAAAELPVRLLVGGVLLAVAYAGVAAWCGPGRDWLAWARNPQHGV
jgi:O-antigen/teichoic acid export membrane protein